MMKKKVIATVLGITMAFTMAACGNGNTESAASTASEAASESVAESATESANGAESAAESSASSGSSAESAEAAVGGWETNEGSTDPDDSSNKDAKEAFEKAVKDLDGYDYELVACLGSQVVSGTNYSCLVKGTPVTPDAESEYMIVVVYEDLEGNASVIGSKDLLEVSTGEDGADGGWSYNEGSVSVDDNADVKEALDKALDNLEGADYEPVAYIGSQTVSGTNYAILCKVTPVTPDAEGTFSLVTVYEDLDGNAEITDAEDVDLSAGAYVDSSASETESVMLTESAG